MLQVGGGVKVLERVGDGSTATTTFWMFEHPLAVKVKMYVTLIGEIVVLISVSFTLPVPEAAGLLMPATAARVQEKVVAGVPLVGIYENIVLLQMAGGERLDERNGTGFTVTTTLYVAGFVHPFADGA